MVWYGCVDSIKVRDPALGPYAFSALMSPEYPIPVTTECLYLLDYPSHVRRLMVPGWRFRWTITKQVDRLEPCDTFPQDPGPSGS